MGLTNAQKEKILVYAKMDWRIMKPLFENRGEFFPDIDDLNVLMDIVNNIKPVNYRLDFNDSNPYLKYSFYICDGIKEAEHNGNDEVESIQQTLLQLAEAK